MNRETAPTFFESLLDSPEAVRFSRRTIHRINDTRPRPPMDTESPETSSPRHSSLATIHGFRVQSYGKRLSPGFTRALRRLAERGFDDPTCVVVKTGSGSRSGITHAGGRYVHAGNPYAAEVMGKMRDLGMEPPPLPFVIAPGEYTLYHEWGHHVDRTWSGDNEEVFFSFRWFSRFYELGVRPSPIARADQAFPADHGAHPTDRVGHRCRRRRRVLVARVIRVVGRPIRGLDARGEKGCLGPVRTEKPERPRRACPSFCEDRVLAGSDEPKMSAPRRTAFSRLAFDPQPNFRPFGPACSVPTRTKRSGVCATSWAARGRGCCKTRRSNLERPTRVRCHSPRTGRRFRPPGRAAEVSC